MRKLVTIRTVSAIEPIPGADAIETVCVDGWKVVAKKGEFIPGHPCVYFEIDSFLPIQGRYEFLRKSSYKKMGNEEGFRLRTVKLRGQISQGLVLRLSDFPEITEIAHNLPEDYPASAIFTHLTTLDLSTLLGVQKYEAPIPAELAGLVAGGFPEFIPKTDQERCQNLIGEIFADPSAEYEVTTKLDGTSFTAYQNNEVGGVCGRNWEFQVNEANAKNTLVSLYIGSGLQAALGLFKANLAVQGELMGPGIQKNRESLKSATLFVFDIYDIDARGFLPPDERHKVMEELWKRGLDKNKVRHVPVLHSSITLPELGITNVSELLKFAEGPSLVHPVREGTVFKRRDGGFSFKAISDDFLLKEKD